MRQKAIIISIKGTKLSRREKNLISEEKPWGIILFKRNLKSFNQIRKLTSQIKILTKNRKFPIIIDEEGGKVSRLSKIINHKISAKIFGDLYRINKKFCFKLYKHYIDSICKILKKLGINTNTIPVLDVLRKNTTKIIGERSFSSDKKIVKAMGSFTIKCLHLNRTLGIIKHIPGHGGTTIDSHKQLPKIKLHKKKLNEIDFYPFKSSSAKLAMTAHILYTNLDDKQPVTFSKKIIKNIIRNKLKFKGILISDDISMKSLKYDLITNAKKSIAAGCNIVLYCSGNINDNFKLIKSLPYIDKFTSKKTYQLYNFLG